jgi:hypothetical protein
MKSGLCEKAGFQIIYGPMTRHPLAAIAGTVGWISSVMQNIGVAALFLRIALVTPGYCNFIKVIAGNGWDIQSPSSMF